MRNAAIGALTDLARQNKNVILLSGDLGYGVIDNYRAEMPEQYYNAGICEQSMSSIAAGLALEGKAVYTYSIANFPTLRCIEQIRNDICYHNANVKIMSVGGGFAYGSLGMSHHATEDIAIMRSLPNMKVFVPADAAEAEMIVKRTAEIMGPCYIRMNKGREPAIHQSGSELTDYALNQFIPLAEGADICILATGPIVKEAIDALEVLKAEGIMPAVYSCPCVKPIDEIKIKECAEKYRYIFTVEEHNIIGGFGSAVSEIIASLDSRACVIRMGLKDTYSSIVGSQQYLRHVYEMDSEAIVKKVKEVIA